MNAHKHRIKIENGRIDQMPVVCDLCNFDCSSGGLVERLIFNYRPVVVSLSILITIFLGFQATKLIFNAGFDKMLPVSHPYIQNYMENRKELRGLGNTIRVVVENTQGDIFDPAYLERLMKINDAIYLTPGVNRAWMKSIWTPDVRWTMVTEEGFMGAPVMPDTYDGSEKSLEQLKINIARAGIVGSLVADNYRSSMILAPLQETDFTTGESLDYSIFSKNIEKIRDEFEAAGKGKIKIHIVGFAKIVGDMIEGLKQVMMFFAFAVGIAALVIYFYTRCIRSTVLLIICSTLAVIWQLGIVSTLGSELDPYAILVPFLVFAIAVSHGMQKMNGIMQDVGRGTHKLIASRYTFRRLFTAGLTALITDMFGFGVLALIDIPVIRDLAVAASIGVGTIIFTTLILTPVLLSYTGVSMSAAKRSLEGEQKNTEGAAKGPIEAILKFFDRFTGRRWAMGALMTGAVLVVLGYTMSRDVKIGDLDPGAPELRPDSRYNRDNAFINANFGLSSDQFAVIVKTPAEGCLKYETLIETDRLARQLEPLPGVRSTESLADAMRQAISGTYEGNPKWFSISRNQNVLNLAATAVIKNQPEMFNNEATVMPVVAYLQDHKAETLSRVVGSAAAFAETRSEKERQFMLAAGSAGIEAVTNMVVEKYNRIMMIFVYFVVTLFCMIAFHNWRAVVVAMLPLVVTSILCEALMVIMGVGIKVATLPVIALGVGVGVDYALYLMGVLLSNMRAGLSLNEAYSRTVRFTGRVVALIGVTMAGAVITWAWSPIKFQADMGILLAFMFFYNMIGALIFIPALSRFILGRADNKGLIYLKGRKEGQELSVGSM